MCICFHPASGDCIYAGRLDWKHPIFGASSRSRIEGSNAARPEGKSCLWLQAPFSIEGGLRSSSLCPRHQNAFPSKTYYRAAFRLQRPGGCARQPKHGTEVTHAFNRRPRAASWSRRCSATLNASAEALLTAHLSHLHLRIPSRPGTTTTTTGQSSSSIKKSACFWRDRHSDCGN